MSPIEASTASRINIRCHRGKKRYHTLETAVKALNSGGCAEGTQIYECSLGNFNHFHLGRDRHPNATKPNDWRGTRQFCKRPPRIMWRETLIET